MDSDDQIKSLGEPKFSPPPLESTRAVEASANWHSSWLKGLSVGLGCGILLTLMGTYLWGDRTPSPLTRSVASASSTSITAAQSVTIATVQSTPIQQTLDATGSVAAAELVSVLSPASGLQIQQIFVEAGEPVEAGQILAVLDNAVLEAQLREAEAQVRVEEARLAELRAGSRVEELARARADVQQAEAEVSRTEADLQWVQERVQRHQMLAANGAIADDQLDEVMNQQQSHQANLAQAQAQLQQMNYQLAELEAGPRPETIAQVQAELEAARERVQTLMTQLEQTQVIAPRSGKIAERHARIGAVTTSSPLFTLIDSEQLELHLKIPETQLPQIRVQQGVWITSGADRNLRLTGKIQEIDPLLDDTSRMATVKVSLPSSDRLKPGMFLRGSIIVSASSGLTVPSQAVLPQSDGSAIVYRLTPDQTVTAQPVELGQLLPDDHIKIVQGLAAGDRIVVKGAAYLRSGDRVQVAEEE